MQTETVEDLIRVLGRPGYEFHHSAPCDPEVHYFAKTRGMVIVGLEGVDCPCSRILPVPLRRYDLVVVCEPATVPQVRGTHLLIWETGEIDVL